MDGMKWYQLVTFCTVRQATTLVSVNHYPFELSQAPDTVLHCTTHSLPLALPHTMHKTHTHHVHNLRAA
jgi:hypothetical protein